MTVSGSDTRKELVLLFAEQLESASRADAIKIAKDHGWLDSQSDFTTQGESLLDEIREMVLQFAQQLDPDTTQKADEIATARGWLDEAGQLTPAGIELIAALQLQSGTRSVFR